MGVEHAKDMAMPEFQDASAKDTPFCVLGTRMFDERLRSSSLDWWRFRLAAAFPLARSASEAQPCRHFKKHGNSILGAVRCAILAMSLVTTKHP